MSLELDERRVAMLAEMGLRLVQPHVSVQAEAVAVQAPVQEPVRAPLAAAVAAPVAQAPVAAPLAVPREIPRDAPRSAPAPLSARVAGVESMDWDLLAQTVADCRACKLCNGRRNTVFGMGDQQADWMIVGEAPGENEDMQGEPFVGQAGALLDNMLRAIGKDRSSGVYLTNVLKCRPPGNRNPEPEELAQCEPYLRRQVALLKPRIILAMGRFAVQALLQSSEPIGKLRGRVHQFNGVPVVVTYHPAYLLRSMPDKAKSWTDLCLAMAVAEGAAPRA